MFTLACILLLLPSIIHYPRYMILTIQLKLFSEDTKWPQQGDQKYVKVVKFLMMDIQIIHIASHLSAI